MRQPVHSALFLLLSFVAIAGLFVLSRAEFLAAVQILVYAGGIMVLFLFTIMLVNVRRQETERYIHRQAGVALLVGIAFYAVVGGFLVGAAKRMSGSRRGRRRRPGAARVLVPAGRRGGEQRGGRLAPLPRLRRSRSRSPRSSSSSR